MEKPEANATNDVCGTTIPPELSPTVVVILEDAACADATYKEDNGGEGGEDDKREETDFSVMRK